MSTRAPAAPSVWNIANALTMLRLLLVPVFGWLLLSHGGTSPTYRYLAAACFALAMITDRIDGDLARSRGLITRFGQLADPIVDKTLVTMAFVGLSIIGIIPWWVTALVLAREWGITLLRFVVIRHGVMPAGRGGKIKTALQGFALFLLTLPVSTWPLSTMWLWIGYALLAPAVILTVVTGFEIVRDALRMVRTSERTLAKRQARRAGRQGSGAGEGAGRE